MRTPSESPADRVAAVAVWPFISNDVRWAVEDLIEYTRGLEERLRRIDMHQPKTIDAAGVAALIASRDSLETEWGTIPPQIDILRDTDEYPCEWDGEGVEPVQQGCVDDAVALLAHFRVAGLPPPWTVYPTADGSVMAEWAFDHVATPLPDVGPTAYRATSSGRFSVNFRRSRPGVASGCFCFDGGPPWMADVEF